MISVVLGCTITPDRVWPIVSQIRESYFDRGVSKHSSTHFHRSCNDFSFFTLGLHRMDAQHFVVDVILLILSIVLVFIKIAFSESDNDSTTSEEKVKMILRERIIVVRRCVHPSPLFPQL